MPLSEPGAAPRKLIWVKRDAVGVPGSGEMVSAGAAGAAGARGRRRPELLALELGVDAQRRDRLLPLGGIAVDTHHDALARVDLALQREGGVGDLALGVVALDGRHHAPELVDLAEVLVAACLHLVGERLDEVGAAER